MEWAEADPGQNGAEPRLGALSESKVEHKPLKSPHRPQNQDGAAGREPSTPSLGILARRKIEAEIIAPIYDEMRKAIGEAKAREILRAAIRRAAITAGAEMAARAPEGADLESFKAVFPLWTQDDALTIEVLRDEPGRFDFNVTRCRYAETYRAMGLGELGDVLSCNRDGAFCEGYDPRIELTRTRTIMGGAATCDFRYRMRTVKAEAGGGGATEGQS